jgi:hypothetical protein
VRAGPLHVQKRGVKPAQSVICHPAIFADARGASVRKGELELVNFGGPLAGSDLRLKGGDADA